LPYVGDTTKYLKRGVNPLMPTKLKGMTSLEIAIITAIVLVIAVAVGWYLYTTFIASTTGQPILNVVSAELYTNGTLRLVLVNPGPVDVQISSVEIAGRVVPATQTIRVGQQATVRVTVSGVTATPGTMLPGRVILSGGQSFLFNAAVKP
jgi:type IV pilus assembly protein PilA